MPILSAEERRVRDRYGASGGRRESGGAPVVLVHRVGITTRDGDGDRVRGWVVRRGLDRVVLRRAVVRAVGHVQVALLVLRGGGGVRVAAARRQQRAAVLRHPVRPDDQRLGARANAAGTGVLAAAVADLRGRVRAVVEDAVVVRVELVEVDRDQVVLVLVVALVPALRRRVRVADRAVVEAAAPASLGEVARRRHRVRVDADAVHVPWHARRRWRGWR